MASNRYEFRYKARDVASAQRMRMLRSKQFRFMVGIWLLSSLVLLVPLFFPQLMPNSLFANPQMIVGIALIYAITLGVLLFITPYLDFMFNRFWRLPLLLRINEQNLRLGVSGGKSKGLELPWKQIQRFDENGRVFILYYGEGNKFIVLPKAIFRDASSPAQAEARFRALLNPRAAFPPSEDNAEAA